MAKHGCMSSHFNAIVYQARDDAMWVCLVGDGMDELSRELRFPLNLLGEFVQLLSDFEDGLSDGD